MAFPLAPVHIPTLTPQLAIPVPISIASGRNRAKPAWPANRVLLHMFGPIGKLTPAQRFENAKAPVQGITKEPVSGVGDDAYYIESGLNTSLYVRKGSSVIQIIVFGFPKEQVKTMEKTLAQEAAAKL